jgi:hypothetical protein
MRVAELARGMAELSARLECVERELVAARQAEAESRASAAAARATADARAEMLQRFNLSAGPRGSKSRRRSDG